MFSLLKFGESILIVGRQLKEIDNSLIKTGIRRLNQKNFGNLLRIDLKQLGKVI